MNIKENYYSDQLIATDRFDTELPLSYAVVCMYIGAVDACTIWFTYNIIAHE